jgi:hypothetical protein
VTDVTNGRVPDGAELSAADEQLLRELTERTRRESPEQRRAYLLRQLEKLSPGCTITITPAQAA